MARKTSHEARRTLAEMASAGLSARQIAAELEISINAVRIRAHRAGISLPRPRRFLQRNGDDGIVVLRVRATAMDELRITALDREETVHQLASKIINIVASENMIEAVLDDRD